MKIFLKKGLEAAKITLCASTCSPSSQTRVKSAKPVSCLKVPKAVMRFSLKSFHGRQSFSNIVFKRMLLAISCHQNWLTGQFKRYRTLFLGIKSRNLADLTILALEKNQSMHWLSFGQQAAAKEVVDKMPALKTPSDMLSILQCIGSQKTWKDMKQCFSIQAKCFLAKVFRKSPSLFWYLCLLFD